jgi:hypothetical protein
MGGSFQDFPPGRIVSVGTGAIFPRAARAAGMYESFYLRAVAPDRPLGAWIRHTVHKAPGAPPRGSLWCTLFDAARGRPFMHKLTTDELGVPPGGWITVGAVPDGGPSGVHGDGGTLTPAEARGRCGPALWGLAWSSREPELRHLARGVLYRLPLPRTKLTSPAPAASFEGEIALEGRDPLVMQQWRGMVGHNWGSEHAERWIWLHGVCFAEDPDAWLDVAVGRVKVGGRMTPWIANGALSVGGRRYRLGGLGARGVRVDESAAGCEMRLSGESGLVLEARAQVPGESAAGWRYADPDGSPHDVVNCSVCALELELQLPGAAGSRALRSAHGGAYELGMREQDHGVPLAPFTDG